MLIVYTITAHGQNKLLSSVVEDYQSGNWQKNSGTNYEYDTNNNLILETELQWNSGNNTWKIQYKITYTYNASNKVTELVNQYANQTTNVLQNSYKITSAYNMNGLLTEQIVYVWKDSNWVVNDKIVISYNGSNLLVGYKDYIKSGAQWLESFRGTYTYNLNNKVTEEVNQDFVNQAWVNSYKTAYTYNNNNQLVAKTAGKWDTFNATWNQTYTNTYGFDDVGNTTSHMLTTPLDLTYNYLDEYTYAPTTTMANFANPFIDKTGLDYLFEDVKRVGKALGYTTSSNDGSGYTPTSRTTYNYDNYNTLDTASSISQTISSGFYHTLVICSNGTINSWGTDYFGTLGNGTSSSSFVPVSVKSLNNIIAVAASDESSLALKNDGTIWAWGSNQYGQLGNGTDTYSNVPIQVSGISDVTSITGGKDHFLALKNDGTVWAWGRNISGELGIGTTVNSKIPTQVLGLSNITALSGGSSGTHSFAIKNDGTVWAWGSNFNGQLGNVTRNGPQITIPVQITALNNIMNIVRGDTYTLALKNDGTVWAFGGNEYGELGNGTNGIDTYNGVPTQILGLSDISAIQASYGHAIALKNDGTAWAWGHNYYGELGNGTNKNSNIPMMVSGLTEITQISIGYNHTHAMKNDGTVWSWGLNLGNGSNTLFTSSNIPVQVTGLCNTLDIEENLMQNSVLIYPNPTKGVVNIELTDLKETELTVYNGVGQKVLTKKINEIKSKLDLNKFNNGIYFLNFKNIDGASIKKIILDK